MKTQTSNLSKQWNRIATTIALVGVIGIGSPQSARADVPVDPLVEGTSLDPLPDHVILALQRYFNRTKESLERALESAARLSNEQAYETLLSEARTAVLASYRLEPHRERISRMLLAQGIAVTYGVVNPQRTGFLTQPILHPSISAQRKLSILRASIELALQYVPIDQQSLSIAYNDQNAAWGAAHQRLLLVQRAWARAEVSPYRKLRLLLSGLAYWRDIIMSSQTTNIPQHAARIDRVETIIRDGQPILQPASGDFIPPQSLMDNLLSRAALEISQILGGIGDCTTFERGTNYAAAIDFANFPMPVDAVEYCALACLSNTTCTSWAVAQAGSTWGQQPTCFLRAEVSGTPVRDATYVSGTVTRF